MKMKDLAKDQGRHFERRLCEERNLLMSPVSLNPDAQEISLFTRFTRSVRNDDPDVFVNRNYLTKLNKMRDERKNKKHHLRQQSVFSGSWNTIEKTLIRATNNNKILYKNL